MEQRRLVMITGNDHAHARTPTSIADLFTAASDTAAGRIGKTEWFRYEEWVRLIVEGSKGRRLREVFSDGEFVGLVVETIEGMETIGEIAGLQLMQPTTANRVFPGGMQIEIRQIPKQFSNPMKARHLHRP